MPVAPVIISFIPAMNVDLLLRSEENPGVNALLEIRKPNRILNDGRTASQLAMPLVQKPAISSALRERRFVLPFLQTSLPLK
jgi:hypothetical protein